MSLRFPSLHSMKRKAHCTLIAAILAVVLPYFAPGNNQQPRIIRPPDKSVLPYGPVEIAVIVPEQAPLPPIRLDGEQLQMSSASAARKGGSARQRLSYGVFFPPAFVVVRSLSPGLHKLRAGKATAEFFVRDREGRETSPRDWLEYVPHPPAACHGVTCVGCHELTKDRRFTNMNSAFSMEKPSTCFDCHERAEFNLTHNHRYESLAFCQMCHEPHGATGTHLLRLPEKKACTLCHE